jgi:sec-independent protein translocase protein TatA
MIMPSWLGAPELIIVLIIVILIFGVGRISKIGGELGKGISAFRKGIKAEDENKVEEEKSPNEEEKKE